MTKTHGLTQPKLALAIHMQIHTVFWNILPPAEYKMQSFYYAKKELWMLHLYIQLRKKKEIYIYIYRQYNDTICEKKEYKSK